MGQGARALTATATVAVLVGGAVGFGPDLTPPASATSSQPLYYVAMGDSLAAGIGASTPASGYVNPLPQQRQHPRERQWNALLAEAFEQVVDGFPIASLRPPKPARVRQS